MKQQHNPSERTLLAHAMQAYGLDRAAIAGAARRHGAARYAKGDSPMRTHKRPIAFALVAAAACFGVGVYAAGNLLSGREVAAAAGNAPLADLFDDPAAIAVNETQSDAGYDVTLLGLVSGENLNEHWSSSWGKAGPAGRTYAVLAVEHSDGIPMDDLAAEQDFSLSNSMVWPALAIPDCPPASYWFSPDRQDIVLEGVRYLLVSCDDLTVFADREVVLCVSTGSPFFSTAAFAYDEATGAITPQADYVGVNLVFDLPLDPAEADPQAAKAMLAQWAGAGGEAGTEEPETEAALPTHTAEEVRANGTLIATETVALTEAPGYSGGKAWFLSGGGALAVDGIAPGETMPLQTMQPDDAPAETVILVTRNPDDTLSAETWELAR